MRTRLILALSLLIALNGIAFAQTHTNLDALQDLKLRVQQQEAQWRGPVFQQKKAMQTGPMGALNQNRDIELVGIDSNGHMWFYETQNLISAQSISADHCWPSGDSDHDMTGGGAHLGEVAVWDAGSIRLTHVEFGDRIWIMDNSTTHYHATHVGGTIGASGLDNNAKGMSYELDYLFSYDWSSAESEMIEAVETYSLHVSNHSYGYISGWRYQHGDGWYWYGNVDVSETEDYGFGYYDNRAEYWDEICYDAPYYVICKSAGNDRGDGPNPGTGHYVQIDGDWTWSTDTREIDGGSDGYDCISYNGTSKNILTVGAVQDVNGGYNGPNSVSMSSFSGWGPTDDGRIKPDIVANGTGLYSTASDHDNAYTSMSGTSMSSPSAAGAVNLLLQYYKDTHVGQAPRAATLKGLIIHTADECGSYDGPDYRFGWGLINVEHAADVILEDSETGYNIQERELEDGDSWSIVYESDGESPITLTMCWTDVPGESTTPIVNDTTRKLVNDLDIRIEHISSGTEYEPWILDPEDPNDAATTGDNFRDNMEKIFIEDPAAGDYEITVSHKGTLDQAPQAYSLIVSGLEWTSDPRIPPTNLVAETDYATGEVTLTWDMDELNDFQEYRIYRDLEQIATSTEETYTDVLEEYGEYRYQVTSYWDEGESIPSNSVSVNWATPVAPSYVHANWSEDNLGEITLSWLHMDTEETAYDDNSAEDMASFPTTTPAGAMFAVRFTASGNGPLAEIGAMLGADADNGFGPVKMLLIGPGDNDGRGGDTLFISEEFTPEEAGWYWENIVDEGVTVEEGEDYWVGVSWSQPGWTALARDTSSPVSGRGVIVGGGVWMPLPHLWNGNLMIRSRMGQQHVVGENGLTDYLVTRNGDIVGEVTETELVDLLPEAGVYTYLVTARYEQGQETGMPFTIDWDGVDVDEASLADRFSIGDAYPNPFNAEVSVPVTLTRTQQVTMTVYDVLGREVQTVTRSLQAGMHRLTWRGDAAAAGVYFLAIQAGGETSVRKVILMK